MNLVKNIVRKLYFEAPQGRPAYLQIILWWELRRIPYNLILAVAGFASLMVFYCAINAAGALKPGEDAVEPIALLAAPIVANIAYTSGWIVECIQQLLFPRPDRKFGLRLLQAGMSFTFLVILFPSVTWGILYFLKIMGMAHFD